jgi:hypothetical protein
LRVALHRGRHCIDVAFDQMVCDDVFQFLEPKLGKCSEHFAFTFDWRRKNAVESRDAIGNDDEQTVFIDSVNVAHFTATKKFQI